MTAFGIECHIVNILQREIPCADIQRFFTCNQQTFPYFIAQGYPAYFGFVAGFLCADIRMELFPYCSGIEPDRITRLAVCIVFLWSAAQPGHHIVFCRKNHTHTQTWHFRKGFVAGYKVHTYFDCSIGSYLIDGLQS